MLPIFRIFADYCSFKLSALSSEKERERNAEKIAYKITLTEPQSEIGKNVSQIISLTEPQLLEPRNCERHAQCTLSFC